MIASHTSRSRFPRAGFSQDDLATTSIRDVASEIASQLRLEMCAGRRQDVPRIRQDRIRPSVAAGFCLQLECFYAERLTSRPNAVDKPCARLHAGRMITEVAKAFRGEELEQKCQIRRTWFVRQSGRDELPPALTDFRRPNCFKARVIVRPGRKARMFEHSFATMGKPASTRPAHGNAARRRPPE